MTRLAAAREADAKARAAAAESGGSFGILLRQTNAFHGMAKLIVDKEKQKAFVRNINPFEKILNDYIALTATRNRKIAEIENELAATVHGIRSMMGRSFAAVAPSHKHKFALINVNGLPRIDTVHGQHTPEELGGMLLENAKAMAEHHLGVGVSEAIITFPSYFEAPQKQALEDAAELSGLACILACEQMLFLKHHRPGCLETEQEVTILEIDSTACSRSSLSASNAFQVTVTSFQQGTIRYCRGFHVEADQVARKFVEARPNGGWMELPSTTVRKQEAWDLKYAESHNLDGSFKITFVALQQLLLAEIQNCHQACKYTRVPTGAAAIKLTELNAELLVAQTTLSQLKAEMAAAVVSKATTDEIETAQGKVNAAEVVVASASSAVQQAEAGIQDDARRVEAAAEVICVQKGDTVAMSDLLAFLERETNGSSMAGAVSRAPAKTFSVVQDDGAVVKAAAVTARSGELVGLKVQCAAEVIGENAQFQRTTQQLAADRILNERNIASAIWGVVSTNVARRAQPGIAGTITLDMRPELKYWRKVEAFHANTELKQIEQRDENNHGEYEEGTNYYGVHCDSDDDDGGTSRVGDDADAYDAIESEFERRKTELATLLDQLQKRADPETPASPSASQTASPLVSQTNAPPASPSGSQADAPPPSTASLLFHRSAGDEGPARTTNTSSSTPSRKAATSQLLEVRVPTQEVFLQNELDGLGEYQDEAQLASFAQQIKAAKLDVQVQRASRNQIRDAREAAEAAIQATREKILLHDKKRRQRKAEAAQRKMQKAQKAAKKAAATAAARSRSLQQMQATMHANVRSGHQASEAVSLKAMRQHQNEYRQNAEQALGKKVFERQAQRIVRRKKHSHATAETRASDELKLTTFFQHDPRVGTMPEEARVQLWQQRQLQIAGKIAGLEADFALEEMKMVQIHGDEDAKEFERYDAYLVKLEGGIETFAASSKVEAAVEAAEGGGGAVGDTIGSMMEPAVPPSLSSDGDETDDDEADDTSDTEAEVTAEATASSIVDQMPTEAELKRAEDAVLTAEAVLVAIKDEKFAYIDQCQKQAADVAQFKYYVAKQEAAVINGEIAAERAQSEASEQRAKKAETDAETQYWAEQYRMQAGDTIEATATSRANTTGSRKLQQHTAECIRDLKSSIRKRWPSGYMANYCAVLHQQMRRIMVSADEAELVTATFNALLDAVVSLHQCGIRCERADARKAALEAALAKEPVLKALSNDMHDAADEVERVEMSTYVRQWMGSNAPQVFKHHFAELLVRIGRGERTYMCATHLKTVDRSCSTPIFETRLCMKGGAMICLWWQERLSHSGNKSVLVWQVVHHPKVTTGMAEDVAEQSATHVEWIAQSYLRTPTKESSARFEATGNHVDPNHMFIPQILIDPVLNTPQQIFQASVADLQAAIDAKVDFSSWHPDLRLTEEEEEIGR